MIIRFSYNSPSDMCPNGSSGIFRVCRAAINFFQPGHRQRAGACAQWLIAAERGAVAHCGAAPRSSCPYCALSLQKNFCLRPPPASYVLVSSEELLPEASCIIPSTLAQFSTSFSQIDIHGGRPPEGFWRGWAWLSGPNGRLLKVSTGRRNFLYLRHAWMPSRVRDEYQAFFAQVPFFFWGPG